MCFRNNTDANDCSTIDLSNEISANLFNPDQSATVEHNFSGSATVQGSELETNLDILPISQSSMSISANHESLRIFPSAYLESTPAKSDFLSFFDF